MNEHEKSAADSGSRQKPVRGYQLTQYSNTRGLASFSHGSIAQPLSNSAMIAAFINALGTFGTRTKPPR